MYQIAGLLYVLIGIIVASNQGYLVGLASLGGIVSALLAVVLWPLLLLGVSLRLAF